MHKLVTISEVTQRIVERSKKSRAIYLQRINAAKLTEVGREHLGCSNLAHAIAPCSEMEKENLSGMKKENIAIVSAYNDMLSAHQPFASFPPLIKRALAFKGATAQFAGGVAAMCDGVTQSQPGMELSLFSRDNIAQSTAVALSHNMYDGAMLLGVCDKIVPGMFIGAMKFGHLPMIFAPAGPMESGISNSEKAKIRQEYAQGKVSREKLLKAESASYHSSGTCTFYGTANSNQMLMEIMGLHLAGSSFVNANTPLRDALTEAAALKLLELSPQSENYMPIGEMIDEKSFVNAIVGLLATGGSTNHTIHLIAMANSCGIKLTWKDFDELSSITPLLCRMYPNGSADVNHFHSAGGMAVVIKELLNVGLLHEDVNTVMGHGLSRYLKEVFLEDGKLVYKNSIEKSGDTSVISSIENPFDIQGGLRVLDGNIGRSVIKTSALKDKDRVITAPAKVFYTQEALKEAFADGKLNHDFVAVLPYQGPKSNGMPELHGLLPSMGALQDKGFYVAIVTDGRMSGASGKVASAIHLSPEAKDGGIIGKIADGDMITLDCDNGVLSIDVADEVLATREISLPDMSQNMNGVGRELFSNMRRLVNSAQDGATIFESVGEESC
ncbi:phosphogluconate dehydratase [Sulfurimonas aquatica]|uniref:Phosphogluconate dehydratase n=1 Tax=Sulfurimonas aquatica TaxID=2672570 RepID=A0A975GDH2_9BACT|nr:phosphogluconate dehydratase [Sulfurimonas aquatica]QSZ42680.1 phosphogluconate dehydratase [Sulfurimonas aquatica]